ncbi:hypothetical protein FEM48_Zijuj12G0088000 [Ziziphus jujuba var. spinosa]|uniref:Uncharacterized protein n=1 Tax=Ziziphus jujuba var. spinosa TaxID=714518 RepID=A0A978UCB7_ZIZJJ|nr:hypothetical protein FEM48_Zijuj12G0088000 [Ziziphus jujuba var. spinosa]
MRTKLLPPGLVDTASSIYYSGDDGINDPFHGGDANGSDKNGLDDVFLYFGWGRKSKEYSSGFALDHVSFIMIVFLNEQCEDGRSSKDLESISNKYFLLLYPSLIEDEDPIPMSCLCSRDGIQVTFSVGRIENLLEFVYAKDMEDFLEPTHGLFIGPVDQQQDLRDIMDFVSNAGFLLELSASREANVGDMASECVVLLLKAAPREATTGLLTNLHRVSAIIGSWNRGISHFLVVQRMLHAIGHSCKQYLCRAMILSISIPEITKIEAIVSELKSSGISGLANAASLVEVKLQRLPRCI